MPHPLARLLLAAAAAVATLAFGPCPDRANETLPGLEARVRVVTDADGVRHLFARSDLDLARALGFVHARDRFFQMDLTRREVSGDLAELLGLEALFQDVQARVFGLRRAAVRSLDALTARERAILQAYADGVNAWLARGELPPEYAELELTRARPWDVVDVLVIGKAIAASLSLDLDLGLVEDLEAYVAAGEAAGFDGEALFFEDVRRAAPMDPAFTVPDATDRLPFVARAPLERAWLARAAEASRSARKALAQGPPLLTGALDRRDTLVGSNEWGVAGRHTASGRPLIANDPHLALDIPSTFYEVHLVVENDPVAGDMNVSGVGFPGAPGVILGQNEHISWGATTNSLDVTDVFMDTLVSGDPACDAPETGLCILSDGELHPVVVGEQPELRLNSPDDGALDNVDPAGLAITVFAVPFRSHGPILERKGDTALVAQYTGFHATREVGTFLRWNRARNLDDFLAGLADFDFGSQNWAYTDERGNLAYFSSAELPLRRDLEQGFVHGLPPFFVRDGSGPANWVPDPARSQGQAIPFAVLPFEEMPQALNPERGFFVNANNDPAGVTADNDPLNQRRPSRPDAIYYLAGGYDEGLRAGRITRLIRGKIRAREPIRFRDMARFQANTQQLDAELLAPHLLEAWAAAGEPGAPQELARFADDPRLREAVERLAAWDFSTPTGIPEGWDASDAHGVRRDPVPEAEVRASVAATVYNVWRAQLVKGVVDARLVALGVPGVGSTDALKAAFHLLSQEPFTGLGASGVHFFPEPASLADPRDRRDATLLAALEAALDLLASDAFAPAFGGSTDLDDYRWGRLHRITFDHPTDDALSVPPQAGFADLAPGLPGLSRDGGFEVVNASGFSARADGAGEFTFGGGPVRRYVGGPVHVRHPGGPPRGHHGPPGRGWGRDGKRDGLPDWASKGRSWRPGPPFDRFPGPGRRGLGRPAIRGINVVPGGPSGVPGDPLYATQLGDWLTADYHEVDMRRRIPPPDALQVELFLPDE